LWSFGAIQWSFGASLWSFGASLGSFRTSLDRFWARRWTSRARWLGLWCFISFFYGLFAFSLVTILRTSRSRPWFGLFNNLGGILLSFLGCVIVLNIWISYRFGLWGSITSWRINTGVYYSFGILLGAGLRYTLPRRLYPLGWASIIWLVVAI
jgi:hypothetical protein